MQSKYLVQMMHVTACVLLYLKFVLNLYFTYMLPVQFTRKTLLLMWLLRSRGSG